MGHIHRDSHEELTDGVASMETSYEHASEGAHSRDEFDAGTKKRRVKENFSSDGGVVADCSFPETNEGNLEDPNTMENAVMGDFQAANLATANASLAERAIEPTLVMLEVPILEILYHFKSASPFHSFLPSIYLFFGVGGRVTSLSVKLFVFKGKWHYSLSL